MGPSKSAGTNLLTAEWAAASMRLIWGFPDTVEMTRSIPRRA